MTRGGLTPRFLAALPEPARPAAARDPRLEEALAWACTEGRAAWPEIELPPEVFVPFLAARLPASDDLDAGLRRLHVADLYFACACLAGVPAAAEAFQRTMSPEIAWSVARVTTEPSVAEDIAQAIYAKLFLAVEGAAAKIAGYAGEGELRTWIRVVAGRMAIDHVRQARRQGSLSDTLLNEVGTTAEDPVLAQLRVRYRDALKDALASVLAGLEPRDRNLLRFRLAGLTADQIGRMYGAHRVTVQRWFARVRREIGERTRALIESRLGVAGAELESVARLADSQLALSVGRLLGED